MVAYLLPSEARAVLLAMNGQAGMADPDDLARAVELLNLSAATRQTVSEAERGPA